MSKIAVVTDTNSGITREEAKKLGVYLLPMPFIVDGTEYFEGVTCTYEHFFEMLEAGAEVSTSQPSPESLTAMWEEALATHDSVVHIPMSSALSGSCDTAKALAAEYNGRVCVVDNTRISIRTVTARTSTRAVESSPEPSIRVMSCFKNSIKTSFLYGEDQS